MAISDHFHPWLESQGHSPFAWSVLGAIAANTSQVGIATGLTCPIIRYHPAIVAQAAATIAVMSDNRFTLTVGAGERLNEHVTGARWPSIPERHAMLGEAIDICRKLWDGRVHTWRGEHYQLDHARLYDAPEKPIPILVGVSGEKSITLAAEKGDGIMATEPKADLITCYRSKAAKPGPLYTECLVAYAPSEEAALKLVHEKFRFGMFGWCVLSELPNVEGFESASKYVTPEHMKDLGGLGPDPEKHLAAIRKYLDAGYDHIALLGVGDDQAGLIDFFQKELKPRLAKL